MLVIALLVVWGGLVLAILNLTRSGREEPEELPRDL
jgi:hypothetical protein